jgi:hypothetical protein
MMVFGLVAVVAVVALAFILYIWCLAQFLLRLCSHALMPELAWFS